MQKDTIQILERAAPLLLVWMPTALSGLLEVNPRFFEQWLAPDLDLGIRPYQEAVMILQRQDPNELDHLCKKIFENEKVGISLTRRWHDSFIRQLIKVNDTFAQMANRSKEDLLQTGDMRNFQTRLHSARISASMQTKAEFLVPYSGTASWKRPDHKANVFEFVAIPLRLGEDLFVAGFDHDLTIN